MLPVRHEVVHVGLKNFVVSRFQNVNHLMNDDVFKAFSRFPGKVGIQTDRSCRRVAASPAGFHPLNIEVCNGHADFRFPKRKQVCRG